MCADARHVICALPAHRQACFCFGGLGFNKSQHSTSPLERAPPGNRLWTQSLPKIDSLPDAVEVAVEVVGAGVVLEDEVVIGEVVEVVMCTQAIVVRAS